MTKKIIVASSKGGIGKTTVALGIAVALIDRGLRVLLCDLDFENRCLDLFMGIDKLSIYNIADVASKRVPVEKAIIRNEDGLSFVSAPANFAEEKDAFKGVPPEDLICALNAAIDAEKPDYVIFDTSAGLCVSTLLAESFKGSLAITVSSHQPAACRGAERAARVLLERGARSAALVITGYETEGKKANGRAGLIDIIDASSVKLLGVVPYDRELLLSHENGTTAPKSAPSSAAFRNIAARLCLERVKLFSGVPGIKRKNIF